MIVIPENNTLRFVKRQYNGQPTGSAWTSAEAPFNRNYFNTRFYDEISANIKPTIQLHAQLFGDFSQYILQTFRNEEIIIQLLSDTDIVDDFNIKIQNVKTDGTGTAFTKTLTKKIDNIAHKIHYSNVNFINYGGFRAFYFTTGIFNNYGVFPAVIETGNYYLNGELPTWLAVGQSIEMYLGIGNANNGTGQITGIFYSDTYNSWIFITNRSYVSTPVTTAPYIIITYQRSLFDVYEYSITGLPAEVCQYIKILTAEVPYQFTTPLELWESDFIYFEIDPAEGLSFLQWKNTKDKFMVDFRTGVTNFCYMPMLTYNLIPEGETELYTDKNSSAELLDSDYKRKFKCEVMAIPRHLIEKLALAIRHEYFYINGKQFVWTSGTWNQERIENTMLYNCDFEVYEPNLLGIFSTAYVNTTPTENANFLLIDDDNFLLIDDNNKLIID